VKICGQKIGQLRFFLGRDKKVQLPAQQYLMMISPLRGWGVGFASTPGSASSTGGYWDIATPWHRFYLQSLESKINEVKISVLICENQWIKKTVQLRFLLRRNDKVQRAAKSSATFNPTYALAQSIKTLCSLWLYGVQQWFFMKVFSPHRGWGVGFASTLGSASSTGGYWDVATSWQEVSRSCESKIDIVKPSVLICENLWINNGTTNISPASKWQGSAGCKKQRNL
jgi:hypothetical protein